MARKVKSKRARKVLVKSKPATTKTKKRANVKKKPARPEKLTLKSGVKKTKKVRKVKKTRKTRKDKGVKRTPKTPALEAKRGELGYWVTSDQLTVVFSDGSIKDFPKDLLKKVTELVINNDEEGLRNLYQPKPLASLFIQGDMPTQLWEVTQKMVSLEKDPTALFELWARLRHNPSSNSRRDLYAFLVRHHIPLTTRGTFLAYKGVTSDFLDEYTKKIDNSPGSLVTMDRKKVDDNSGHACSQGLHVGAFSYASGFSQRTVLVEVCPSDVVSVPLDCDGQKMRVCRYFVVRETNDALTEDIVSADWKSKIP